MDENLSGYEKFKALDLQYREYILKIKQGWLLETQKKFTKVYEIMSPREQAEVHDKISEWAIYITPIAEAWWKQRGYGVIWPEDDSLPMSVYEIGAEQKTT